MIVSILNQCAPVLTESAGWSSFWAYRKKNTQTFTSLLEIHEHACQSKWRWRPQINFIVLQTTISNSPHLLQVLCCYWLGSKITQMSKVFSGSGVSPINVQSNTGLAAHALITSSLERRDRDARDLIADHSERDLKDKTKGVFTLGLNTWVCTEDQFWCCIHLKLVSLRFWPPTRNTTK